MKLTKEECMKYKKELQFAYDNVGTKYDDTSIKDAISLGIVYYEKLMNEHFDNPPLKFEELKEGKVVWYEKEEDYIKIFEINGNSLSYTIFGSDELLGCVYEEVRFYESEVKE